VAVRLRYGPVFVNWVALKSCYEQTNGFIGANGLALWRRNSWSALATPCPVQRAHSLPVAGLGPRLRACCL
jgi:hypothetical protein